MEFNVEKFLETSTLVPCKTFRRGEPRLTRRPEGKRYEASGMNVPVSEAPWSDLLAQVTDAERFLREHKQEIARLCSFPGVEGVSLDFPTYQRVGAATWMQTDRFPASLVRIAGELGLELELSIYPPAEDRNDEPV
jgi:hypothetical protein